MKKKCDGFTFIEMMIALSIFSILILIVYATFFSEIHKYDSRATKITMNIDANRALNAMTEQISMYGDINVVGDQYITTGGVIMIDVNDDGLQQGSLLNVINHQLVDNSGTILCNHVDNITFILGPDNTSNVGVAADVILIKILLEKKNTQYFLKGGVNIAK